MTAQKLYESALALIVSDTEHSEDYTPFVLPVINLLLGETFDINNSMRAAAGEPMLARIPSLESVDSEIPYEDKLVTNSLIYGVCAKLLVEDDIRKAVYFQNLYVNGANECDRALVSDITDLYR